MNRKLIIDLLNFKPFDPWCFDAKNPEGKKTDKKALETCPVDYDKLRFNELNKLRTS